MNYGRFFLISSCVILLLSFINISLAPIINKKIKEDWGLANCEKLSDDLEDEIKKNPWSISLMEHKFGEFQISACKYQKAMYNMEYTSSIFNIVIGFICVVLGAYWIQDSKIPKTNFIAMGAGLVGFILTFIYIILNGIVFTQYGNIYSDTGKIEYLFKRDEDGAFAEYEEDKGFKCFYFGGIGEFIPLFAKYSDYIKSQYNYNKQLNDTFYKEKNLEKEGCTFNSSNLNFLTKCMMQKYIKDKITYPDANDPEVKHNCTKLYYNEKIYYDNDFNRYNIGVRFLMSLLLNIFMLPCYCAMIFFAFSLSKDASDYTRIKV